ncbi:probable protein phosphatase 2C 42 [Tanacetum coccineum]
MTCSLPHTDSEIEALVQKLIDEDKDRQNVILDLALQFENSCTAKDDLRNAYEKCDDISQESRALIDSFLKEGSDEDYKLNLSMYGNDAKLEKQMDAKLAWLLEKYYYRSQESVGCSSSHADLYLTEKELHLDEEALRETLEEQTMDEKAREEKIRQKQADDDEFFMEFRVFSVINTISISSLYPQLLIQLSQIASNFNNENDPWEYSLDIDDSDLHLTPVMRSSSSARVEPSPYTPNPVTIIPGHAGIVQLSSSTCVEPSSSTPNSVRIIPGPAGVVQRAKLLRENVFILDLDGGLMSTQEYIQKVVEDVGEDDDFNIKLEQVVAIVKSCSLNVLGDLNITMKDLSGTIPGTIHHTVIGDGGYGKDITVGAAMILANVSVFTPKSSEHYLNITKKNMVKVFRKDTVSLV